MVDERRKPPRGPGRGGRSGPGRRLSASDRTGRTGRAERTVASTGAPGSSAARAGRANRPRLTGRAAVLVLVLAVLMVSYASSLRAYLQQRAHLEDLTSSIAERQAGIDDLEQEKARWNDPAYLEQQARARFGYVAPGETSYVVLDENGERLDSETGLQDPATVLKKTPTAWWTTAWDSVELAGNPPRVGQPPAAEIDGPAESRE